MYFDGALNSKGEWHWDGIVLMSPEGVVIPKAYQLGFPTTNNITCRTSSCTLRHLKIIADSKFKAGDQPRFSLLLSQKKDKM